MYILYYIILYHIISYHIISYYIILYYIILYYIRLYYIICIYIYIVHWHCIIMQQYTLANPGYRLILPKVANWSEFRSGPAPLPRRALRVPPDMENFDMSFIFVHISSGGSVYICLFFYIYNIYMYKIIYCILYIIFWCYAIKIH